MDKKTEALVVELFKSVADGVDGSFDREVLGHIREDYNRLFKSKWGRKTYDDAVDSNPLNPLVK